MQKTNIWKVESAAPAEKPREVVLKEFGLLMALVATLLTAYLFYHGNTGAILSSIVALAFLKSAYFRPMLLSPLEWIWMRFAEALHVVMTRVIVTLLFFLIITPLGLLMRLSKRDGMGQRFDRAAESYWQPVEEDGPQTRPLKPY